MLLAGLALTSAQENPFAADADPNARLLLTSDELVYNLDSDRVVASGDVQIAYDDYRMVADRVVYDQQTGRLSAFGNIELVEPDGNRIYAEELDLTDDFADGFVNALRVETPDNTRLVAESAERTGGVETTLNNGVYTACEVCREDPSRAPLWQIKARRVIQNGENRTIRLEQATFELFGQPIAVLPYLVVPDYGNQRRSGFLAPSVSYTDDIGLGLTVPYYFVFSPTMDATVSLTGLTQQGFLAETEFRKRYYNGDVTLRTAGIYQLDRRNFDSRSVDYDETARGLVSSTGLFNINEKWTIGWDLTAQSDRNFGRTYGIEEFSDEVEISDIYLTGLNERNYFEARGMYADIQTPVDSDVEEQVQPYIHPVVDYSYVADEPVAGGEVSFDVNAVSLSRERDARAFEIEPAGRVRGLEGVNNRLTGEIEWRRQFFTSSGLVVTPIAAARGDVHGIDLDVEQSFATNAPDPEAFESRSMVTAGLEARYPLLVSAPTSSHIFEPIAQIFVRPDEPLAGGLPNEDAQSFIFDTTSLFERDKFSGFDRIEGGTRANIGFRYTGTFSNGFQLNGAFGQSYQIAGVNSFAVDGLVNAGADSGLESDVSDYVGSVGFLTPLGFGMSTGTRWSRETMDIERFDVDATYGNDRFTVGAGVSYVRGQPEYNVAEDRYEVRGEGQLRFNDNWSIYGAAAYDAREYVLTDAAIGLGYDDECFSFRIGYIEERDRRDLSGSDWSIGASLTFRTLGEIGIN